MMDRQKIELLWRELLQELDPAPGREGLRRTPERIAGFYEEFFNPSEPRLTDFESDGYDQMVVERDIPFYSLCEHHCLPFYGVATIGYLPSGGRIIGLSRD